MTKHSPTKLH